MRGPGFQLSAVLLSVECLCSQSFQHVFLGFGVSKPSCYISSFQTGRNPDIMFQRLALSSGYGWNRFMGTVDRVMPRRGDTLALPFPDSDGDQRPSDLQ
jgi:hypothetical protein